jgi:hypothetical protein
MDRFKRNLRGMVTAKPFERSFGNPAVSAIDPTATDPEIHGQFIYTKIPNEILRLVAAEELRALSQMAQAGPDRLPRATQTLGDRVQGLTHKPKEAMVEFF